VQDRPRDGFLVVGLGNPGEEYRSTRHNVGFRVVDVLAARTGNDIRRPEFLALTARAMLGRTMVLMMKPQTFMNAAGRSAAAAIAALDLEPQQLIAITDDLDLPLGRLRVRAGGGSGGHRGIASLIDGLGTSEFPRVRIGVGRPPEGCEAVDHVLSRFTAEEDEAARTAIGRAADAVEHIVASGVVSAMRAFNGN